MASNTTKYIKVANTKQKMSVEELIHFKFVEKNGQMYSVSNFISIIADSSFIVNGFKVINNQWYIISGRDYIEKIDNHKYKAYFYNYGKLK
jgi:hypothetical protein